MAPGWAASCAHLRLGEGAPPQSVEIDIRVLHRRVRRDVAQHITNGFDRTDQVFLVQLSGFLWQQIRSREERMETARHLRVFPGEGVHDDLVAELIRRLGRRGYAGDYSFEVFNDDYQQVPLPTVAARARRSAIWLGSALGWVMAWLGQALQAHGPALQSLAARCSKRPARTTSRSHCWTRTTGPRVSR